MSSHFHCNLNDLNDVLAAELLETTDVIITDFDVEEVDVEMLNRFCNDQVRSSTQYTTIKNSNATRWNSVLTMFNSFKKNCGKLNSGFFAYVAWR